MVMVMRLNECSVLMEETGGRGCERRKGVGMGMGMGMGVCKRKVSR